MIVVQMCGGLGNQMFQYAFGRYLSIKHATDLWLDISYYENQERTTNTPRKFELDRYGIKAKIKRINFSENNSESVLRTFISWLPKTALSRPTNIINEKQLDFYIEALDAPNDCYLIGYWQSERYFKPISDVIRSDFSLKFRPANSNFLPRFYGNDHQESISIHVRRGDYVTNVNTGLFHGVIGKEWYYSAMQEMRKKFRNCMFYVFSDDIDWARQNIGWDFACEFVDLRSYNDPTLDLHVMSHCNHHIIANSSFSWWAAWLNNSKEKIIIAPKHWFSARSVDDSRYGEGWIVL